MANLDFRSDVSMQDANVPKLVLFHLVLVPSLVPARLPVSARSLQEVAYGTGHPAGNQISTTAFRVRLDQHASIHQPVLLLFIGSDPKRCNLVLDRLHADPVHCQLFAQLNSGFDMWIIKDRSALGTRYRRLKEKKDPPNPNQSEELEAEELIHGGCRAIQGLRYLKIGLYEFHCQPSEDKVEIEERNRWFRRHEPVPVDSRLWEKQLAGRRPDIQKMKNIGEGGFGEVFKYMETRTGLLVAVKRQKVSNDHGVANVRREVQSMKNLNHRNVAKILDFSEQPPEDGQRVFHLLMPLYPCSLRDALPRMRSGSRRNAMIQMIEGLKYIHRNGFLHRDIKPENTFISAYTPTNIVLGDLGLLSPVGAIGRMAGTAIYKAPEVQYEDRQTTAIDVYALGITFLQMLDGRACKDGFQGLKKWVEGLWDHPPPPPFSRLLIQMTAPCPPQLRPSLDIIQDLIVQHVDLPERIQRPKLDLEKTMDLLEKKHAPPAVFNPPVPMAVPGLLQPQAKLVKPRFLPHENDINEQDSMKAPTTKKAGPLDLVHEARVPAPREPTTVVPGNLESLGLMQDSPKSTPKPVQRQPSQCSPTRGVDFTEDPVEPSNIFAKQKIELLEAQLRAEKQGRMRLAEELRNQRRGHRRWRKANRLCHEPYPGQWPSQPTHPGSGSSYRSYQSSIDVTSRTHASQSSLTSNGIQSGSSNYRGKGSISLRRRMDRHGRSSRARIDTHAWHNERTSKREQSSFQTRMLDGLTLALKTGASGIGITISKSLRWMLGF